MKQFGEVKGFETTAQRKDGANFYIRESARAVKDKFGNISYYEGTIENINSSKEAEKALIEAKEEAEKSDKLKSEFLAQMSHEIRTPINVILSFSNLIKDEVKSYLSDELVNSFGIIDNAARRTMRTIDLMLNMSQIQTGSYYLKKKKIDLYTDILLEIKPEFAHLASEKNLQFDIELAHDNPVVEADHYSVTKIFDNLIHNAIKYTNDGYVKVIIDKTEDDKIIASVKDSGIGIAEEYLPMLFQPFSQEEHGYTRKYEGNGLGLALVKKYCDMNNLNIEVQSKKDEGTEFKVYFK